MRNIPVPEDDSALGGEMEHRCSPKSYFGSKIKFRFLDKK